MLDREPEEIGQKFTRRQVLELMGKGLLAVPFVAACSLTPRQSEKIIPFVEANTITNDLNGLNPLNINFARVVRTQLFEALREFVPTHYLSQGIFLNQDGLGYWAKVVEQVRKTGEPYSFDLVATMGKDGQPYTASVKYDEWRTLGVHVRAGSVPAFIAPRFLPKEVPGAEWLSLPADSLKEIAELAYDLPQGLDWRKGSYVGKRYMGAPPNNDREFVKLEAKGRTDDGREIEFSIDEQSFSGINIKL